MQNVIILINIFILSFSTYRRLTILRSTDQKYSNKCKKYYIALLISGNKELLEEQNFRQKRKICKEIFCYVECYKESVGHSNL